MFQHQTSTFIQTQFYMTLLVFVSLYVIQRCHQLIKSPVTCHQTSPPVTEEVQGVFVVIASSSKPLA